jgi:hypothetical protein
MVMARHFFDVQNATGLGPSFSPAQIAPIQDLASRQLPIAPASRHAMPNFNGAWVETERATSLPQSTLSTASWASEFNSGVFVPGSIVHQSITPAKGAFTLQPDLNMKSECRGKRCKAHI